MGERIPQVVRGFVMLHPEAEGVIQHVGLATWDLVVVDVTGTWVRAEFPSQDAAEAACHELGVRSNLGWEARLVRRMNRKDHWRDPDGQRRAL